MRTLLLLLLSANLAHAEPVNFTGTLKQENGSYRLLVVEPTGTQSYRLVIEDPKLREKARALHSSQTRIEGDLRGPNLTVWTIEPIQK